MIEIPKFKTLAEEVEWFNAHAAELEGYSREGTAEDDELHQAHFSRINKDEAVRQAKEFSARKGPKSALINLRIPHEDLEKARTVAARKGIGYQTLLKSLIHEALERA